MCLVWSKKPFGSTPVQATGWINDKPFYFRSRYKTSEIEIYNKEDINITPEDIVGLNEKETHIIKEYVTPYEAGYIKYDEAERLITGFLKNYLSEEG